MAESDPRRTRPAGEPGARRAAGAEDPLVELARIVSEDGRVSGARAQPQPRQVAPTERGAHSADLESELLQELETSFAPRRREPPLAAARPAPRAPEPEPSHEDELLRSVEAELGDFGRQDERPRPAAARPAAPPDLPPSDLPPLRARRDPPDRASAAERVEAVDPPRLRETARDRIAARQLAEGPTSAPRTAAPPQRRAPAPPVMDPLDEEPPIPLPLRRRDTSPIAPPRPMPAPGAGRASQPAAPVAAAGLPPASAPDWHAGPEDYRDELRRGFDGSADTAEDRYSDPDYPDAASELEPTYSDPTVDPEWDDGQQALHYPGAAPVPPVAPRQAAPARNGQRAGEQRGREAPRSRRGLFAAAGVLAVLVLGGAVLALMRPGADAPASPPPVIAAPSGEVKVAPPSEQQAASAEGPGDAVYDRVAGETAPAQEQVVDGAEEPQEIARVILPPPEADPSDELTRAIGADAGAPAPDPAAAEAAAEPIGPRRVRTYVVRPDGTIVSSADAPAPPRAEPPPEQQVAAVAPIEPVPVRTVAINEGGQPTPPVAEPPTASVTPSAAAPAPAAAQPEPPPAPAADAAGAAAEQPAPAEVAAVAPEDPAAAPGAGATAAPAPIAGGFVMQVSSQRSKAEAEAALAALKQRHPELLGNLPAEVQEADLGDKGIYYRARVGSWASRAEAIEVCEALQAAGGSCFVTR